MLENFAGVLRTARAGILDSGGMSAARFDAALDELQHWGRRDDAAFWYALSWAEGVREE